MALYPAPNPKLPIYNPTAYHVDTGNKITIDEQYLAENYLQFPLAQGTENFGNVNIGVDETISGNIILNGTSQTNYIQFPDGSQQFTASVGDGSAFLNGGTVNVPQQFTGYNDFTQNTLFGGNVILNGVPTLTYIEFPDGTKQYTAPTGASPYTVLTNQSNTYDSGFIQTFTANSATEAGLTAPIVFTNTTTTGGIGSLFIDPDNNRDITLYSNQSSGAGLTVRNPTNSFTVNPTTINGVSNTANFINSINCTYDISVQGVLKVYDNTTFTNNSTIDQQAGNLVISNNSSGGAIVLNQVGATNPQVLVSSNAGTVVQNALYVKNPSNQALYSSIGQGDNLTIFNECASGLNSNIVFQLNNPVSGQPVVQPLIIYSASVNCNQPLYAYQGIILNNGVSSTGLLTQNSSNTTVLRNNYLGGDIQLVTTSSGGVTTNVMNLNSSNQTLFSSPTTNSIPTQIATTGYCSIFAPLASPIFTGNPQAPTPTTLDNDTSIATTAYVQNNLINFAPLASPIFTGNPQAPTPTTNDNDTSIATTAYVQNNLVNYAPVSSLANYALLASPIFTGNPQAPTPASSDNDTSIATTAFVKTAISGISFNAVDSSITGAVQEFSTPVGLPDTSVVFQTATTPLPLDTTSLTLSGLSNFFSSNLSFTLTAQPYLYLIFQFSSIPFSTYPGGASTIVITDSNKVVYNLACDFKVCGNAQYCMWVLWNTTLYPTLENSNNGRIFTFTLQSIPQFKG